MANLQTSYMGLELKNPVVVASSGLTDSLKKVKKLGGAGALVLKSLFEEDIANAVAGDGAAGALELHPEAMDYVQQLGMLQKPNSYLELVEKAVQEMDVPIIASLNCSSEEWWLDYAQRIERMGAHGLELNLSPLPMSLKKKAAEIEDELVKLVVKCVEILSIPLAVKVGNNYTALPNFLSRLERAGAKGIVIFNRYYRPDIDLEALRFRHGQPLSSEEEYSDTLRWVGLLSEELEADLAATTGIHSAQTALKMILAGAGAVQLCSVLYRKGVSSLQTILQEMEEWMDKKGYSNIPDMRGLLALKDKEERSHYQRLQYVKALKGTRY